MAIPAISSGQLFPSSLRSSSSVFDTECNPESNNTTSTSKNSDSNPVSPNSFGNFLSTVYLASDGQEEISEKPELQNEQMIGTIPLRLPMPLLPLPLPPPPPPPPPPGIQIKPKNGSSWPSSGGTKWTLRIEARDGNKGNSMGLKAEGIIEIPKPQSVASLREQIARKLEVKMPFTSSPRSRAITIGNDRTKSAVWVSEFNRQYPYISLHNDVSKTLKFGSTPQSSNQTALQKQLFVVHEPMERHISCITPVPFNRTTLSSPVIISTNICNTHSSKTSAVIPITFSPSTIAQEHEENNDYTYSTTYDKEESNQLNNYQKLNPVKQRVDDRPQPSFPLAVVPVASGTVSFRSSSVRENANNFPLIPSLINGLSKDRNEMAIGNLEIPVSINHDDVLPANDVGTDLSQEIERQFRASSSSIATTSTTPSFSKPMELRTKMQPEISSLSQLQSEQQNQAGSVTLKTYNNRLTSQRGLKSISDTISRCDAHTENSSWYRIMFKKMHAVDQLGKSFH